MATQVEPISVSLNGATQSADERVAFQNGGRSIISSNLMTGRKTGQTSPENNGVFVTGVQLKFAGVGLK